MSPRRARASWEGNLNDGKSKADFGRGMFTAAGSALATRAPFHLEATVRVLQRRPSNPVDGWECGRYLRVLALPEGLALVEVQNRGTIDNPDLRFSIRGRNSSAAMHLEACRMLRRILGLDVDPTPLQHLAETERAPFAPPVSHCAACGLRGSRVFSKRSPA